MHACVAGSIIYENLTVFIGNPSVGKKHIHHVSDILPSFRSHKKACRLRNHLRRILKRSHVHIKDIAESGCTSAHSVGKVEPSSVGLYRMRTFSVLGFLDRMVVTVIDDLFFCNDYLFHAVDKRPAYASAAACIDETVLRAGIEGIFSIYEFRMENDIPLLRGRLHVRKALPVHKVFCACHTCRCNS